MDWGTWLLHLAPQRLLHERTENTDCLATLVASVTLGSLLDWCPSASVVLIL